MAERQTRARTDRPRSARELTNQKLSLAETLRAAGPGLITGGADNDPAGIALMTLVAAVALPARLSPILPAR